MPCDEAEQRQGANAVAVERGGWKEKSKPASVLIVARRPMRSTTLTNNLPQEEPEVVPTRKLRIRGG